MSGKAIYFFIVVLLFALFASFNLDSRVSINLGFRTVENIPIFLFALFSFLIGFVLMLPFFIAGAKKDKNNKKSFKSTEPLSSATSSVNGIQEVELKGEKKSWFQKLKERKKNDDNKK